VRIVAVLSLSACGAASAAAQVPFQVCRDRQDRLVTGVVDNTVTYAGLATYQQGRPVIIWNANSNRHLSDTEQIYIYLHECAHHRLGHLEQPRKSARWDDDARWEVEADCWAIQLMVDGGMIKGRHLAQLERSRRTVRGDATHLGGEAHVRSLRECLEVRTDRKAWAAALHAMIRAGADGFAGSRGPVVDSVRGAPVYASLLDVPGTYDCEIVGAAVRCMLFASRKPSPAVERYEALVKLVRDWLPAGWSAVERRSEDGAARTFLAQNGMDGTLLTLAQNGARVHFLLQRLEDAPRSSE